MHATLKLALAFEVCLLKAMGKDGPASCRALLCALQIVRPGSDLKLITASVVST